VRGALVALPVEQFSHVFVKERRARAELISSSSFPVASLLRMGSGLNSPDEDIPKIRAY
jgi:hypothetical protein